MENTLNRLKFDYTYIHIQYSFMYSGESRCTTKNLGGGSQASYRNHLDWFRQKFVF